MKIVIFGGSGLIGNALAKNLSASHEVQCLNRSAFKSVMAMMMFSFCLALCSPLRFVSVDLPTRE